MEQDSLKFNATPYPLFYGCVMLHPMEQLYKTFVFDSFALDQSEGRIELRYSLDNKVQFLEKINLALGIEYQEIAMTLMDRALFALHLMGGTSYYKTYCPPNIDVRSEMLSEEHAAFWNEVYRKGLGEFFYKNQLDPTGLIRFPYRDTIPLRQVERSMETQRVLLPIGGGKDSIVAMEMLKKTGFDITLLRIGGHPLIDEIVKLSDLPTITLERTLSPNLLQLNAQGAMNGHVPFTGYVSCVSAVIALLYGFDTIVMSNERSASEGNIEYRGMTVNHQWSKSFEFEQMFATYIQDFITHDLAYFSMLRHLSELAITRYFCTMPEYFDKVTSCNANWKTGRLHTGARWCGECPKCAFSFCLFAAFLPKETLTDIFGKNLFEDSSLALLYRMLLGTEGSKPFDCVGTSEETQAAFLLAHERGDLDTTPVMQMFLKEVLPAIKDPDALKETALRPSAQHAIPKEFLSALHGHS